MLDDRSAVQQARRGDERAWTELYERHSDLVFRLAYRVVRDRDAALDVVQEAFVKASTALAGFREESSFRSWVAAIAINEARSWLRKRSREPTVALASGPEPASTGRPADRAVADSELAGHALRLIETLPDRQRDAVLLRTTEGLSYREIAEALGSTEGSVRVSYHHGIRKLREMMSRFAGPGTPPGGEVRER